MGKKDELYNALKEQGVVFTKPYVKLTLEELEGLAVEVKAAEAEHPSVPDFLSDDERLAIAQAFAELSEDSEPPRETESPADITTQNWRPPETLAELEQVVIEYFKTGRLTEGRELAYRDLNIPVTDRGADRAGLTYSYPEDQPIRIDTAGRIWFLDEVAKPAIPKARMVRKTRYIDPGVQKITRERNEIQQAGKYGDVDEVFEVAGEEKREMTTITTLPSYQVGKYKDVRFPFMIHTYNNARGFDFYEVRRFFGGAEFVPATVKLLYVGNQLCYDIASTRATIDQQFARLTRR